MTWSTCHVNYCHHFAPVFLPTFHRHHFHHHIQSLCSIYVNWYQILQELCFSDLLPKFIIFILIRQRKHGHNWQLLFLIGCNFWTMKWFVIELKWWLLGSNLSFLMAKKNGYQGQFLFLIGWHFKNLLLWEYKSIWFVI